MIESTILVLIYAIIAQWGVNCTLHATLFTCTAHQPGHVGLRIKIKDGKKKNCGLTLQTPCVEHAAACGITNGPSKTVCESRSLFNMRIMSVQSVTH